MLFLVTFWATFLGIPLYMIVSLGTGISGGVNYGWGFFKTLPGILGFVPVALGVGIIFMDRIVSFYRRITRKKQAADADQQQQQ